MNSSCVALFRFKEWLASGTRSCVIWEKKGKPGSVRRGEDRRKTWDTIQRVQDRASSTYKSSLELQMEINRITSDYREQYSDLPLGSLFPLLLPKVSPKRAPWHFPVPQTLMTPSWIWYALSPRPSKPEREMGSIITKNCGADDPSPTSGWVPRRRTWSARSPAGHAGAQVMLAAVVPNQSPGGRGPSASHSSV